MPPFTTYGAVTTQTSANAEDAKKRVLSLYRKWMKSAEELPSLYYLELPASTLRRRIRAEFEKNRYVNDLSTVDILIFKGQTELQETLNLWKQKTHIMRFLETEEASFGRGVDGLAGAGVGDVKRIGGESTDKSFLGRFLAGRE
ncbi:NADH/ubiquinone oxidoreductase [Paraphysoderma sedebokerense]|nr:NADH/ubiquinone oxidoreductase [Paraphysoderma sedebokerense]